MWRQKNASMLRLNTKKNTAPHVEISLSRTVKICHLAKNVQIRIYKFTLSLISFIAINQRDVKRMFSIGLYAITQGKEDKYYDTGILFQMNVFIALQSTQAYDMLFSSGIQSFENI